MTLVTYDHVLVHRAPGVPERREVFPTLRACLVEVEKHLMRDPVHCAVLISDLALYFDNPDEREGFEVFYDLPDRSAFFPIDEYHGPLFDIAMLVWWSKLKRPQRWALELKAKAMSTDPDKPLPPLVDLLLKLKRAQMRRRREKDR